MAGPAAAGNGLHAPSPRLQGEGWGEPACSARPLSARASAIAHDLLEPPEQAPRPSRRPLRGRLRMRLIGIAPAGIAAAYSALILRRPPKRASRRMGRGKSAYDMPLPRRKRYEARA